MPLSRYFGRYELCAVERTLRRDGAVLPVGSRALDVLIALTDRPGELMTKDALLDRAWPGRVVEEANVHQQVSLLRKLLGAGAIATVAGIGYRFALPVRHEGEPPSNLPADLTRFVGRDALLAQAEALLPATRLLTLIGIGGSGKSRLALKVAERRLGSFAGGAWFVDLAPVGEAAQVPTAVAHALGVAEDAGGGAVASLLHHLRSRRLLLVLDNCEHVIGAVAELLSRALAAAPLLTALCTSREGLGIPGEQLLAIPPMEVPLHAANLEPLRRCESVELFVDRARWVVPGFEPDDATLVDVIDICRRLDGIPLAIELAAARTRLLAPRQIAERLEGRLSTLLGTRRAAPRQQTLHAALQWSYEHLDADEQALLRALSVCAGGCDLRTATALVAGDEMAVLDRLERLADRALLVTRTVSGLPRYHLLETVRQHAAERLDAAGESAAVRQRHLEHFVVRAEQIEALRGGTQQPLWGESFDRDRDNLLQALAESASAPSPLPALRLAAALRNYWPARGLLDLGHRLTEAAVARAGEVDAGGNEARHVGAAHRAAAWLCELTGRSEPARGHLDEALAIARRVGDPAQIAMTLAMRGMLALGHGELGAARVWLEEALPLAARTGDEAAERYACNAMAGLLWQAEGPDAAEPLLLQKLEQERRRGDALGMCESLLNLAAVAVDQHRGDVARSRLVEAATLQERIASRYLSQHLLDIATHCAAQREAWAQAVRWRAASSQQRRGIGSVADGPLEDRAAGHRARAVEALGVLAVEAAEGAGRRLDHDAALAEVRAWIGAGRPD